MKMERPSAATLNLATILGYRGLRTKKFNSAYVGQKVSY